MVHQINMREDKAAAAMSQQEILSKREWHLIQCSILVVM